MIDLPRRRQRTIKAVVFDLGGVLIELHSKDANRELIEKYGLLQHTFASMTRSSFESHPRSITELAMIGQVETAEYLDAFLHECSFKDPDGLRLNRLAALGRERANVFAMAEDLKRAGFICCVLSNTIALHWDKLCLASEYPSLALQECFRVSPDQARQAGKICVLFVATAIKVPMSQCLLVDDTSLNVDSARAAGWQAVLFSDAAQLQRDLDNLLEYRNL